MARALAALVAAAVLAVLASPIGCGSAASPSPSSADDAGEALESGSPAVDGAVMPADGSYGVGDASVSASRFVTGVVSFLPGPCAGFGAASMPGIVEGPPVGGGTGHGSIDVASLGNGGTLVVSFAPNAIVDGPGPDFIVFENPFWIDGNPSGVYAEPGEVSVSDDGTTWQTFPCTPTYDPSASDGTGTEPPYGTCGGWHIVYSAPGNGISPLDPATAGGDAFDLADLGVTHARYVRIVDKTAEGCPEAGPGEPTTNGFDLDAVAIVNAEQP
ncbi:MAG TPA: hypothetical protein VGM06_17840 [Polyangiaceae bacterium]